MRLRLSIRVALRRSPLIAFFGGAYLLSLIALVVLGLPKLHGGSSSALALAVFPVMVVGVGAIGAGLTALTSGRAGLDDVRDQLRRPVRPAWFAVALVPPLVIVGVLLGLSVFVSTSFSPNFFVFGVAAGLLAGFCEEFGWTAFAYPRMRQRFGAFLAAVLLGLLWGLWHLPVVDSLGAASPHGTAWSAFFCAFVALLTALRVLIAWAYDHTGSLRVAQLVHASSTGFLVVLSPPHVTPSQEAGWYFAYAIVLWVVVLALRIYRPVPLHRPRHERARSRAVAT